jgi:FixJ family two-component response regulator
LREVVTESLESERVASLRRFREQVFEDERLQTELLKITDREKFLDAVVAAGVERGFAFEMGEVESEFNRRRGEWMERSLGA